MLPAVTAWADPGGSVNGGMTGIAVYHRASGIFAAGEYDFMAAGSRVYGLCSEYKGALAIGWERFTIGPGTHKKASNPEQALEVIGVIRYWAVSWGCQLLTPAYPGDRNLATRQMLEKIGWWVKGKDDAQAAAQHLLAWILRTGQLPARERELLG